MAVSPEEVLFRSIKAPTSSQNDALYDWTASLQENELPDSDLLKALHAYSSDFYEHTFGEDAEVSYQSMDESAILALGILLEEACNATLSNGGDLALVEIDEEESVRDDSETGTEGDDEVIEESEKEVIESRLMKDIKRKVEIEDDEEDESVDEDRDMDKGEERREESDDTTSGYDETTDDGNDSELPKSKRIKSRHTHDEDDTLSMPGADSDD